MQLGGPTSWPIPLAAAIVIAAVGLMDGHAVYRRYFHGEQAMAMVTHAERGRTTVEVQGHACAIPGEHGRVGQMLPVAYPHGQPGECIVRRPSTFSFAAGTLVVAALLAGFALFRWRMLAAGPATDPPTAPPRA